MERNNIPDKMKNPLLDTSEDISTVPVQHLSLFEKIGMICALIISILIMAISDISFYIDVFIKSNYTYAFIDIIINFISLGAIYFLIKAFKRRIITDVLIDTAFQEGLYARLRPLIENIAQSQVDTNIILDRLDNVDLKVQNVLKQGYARDVNSSEFMKEPLAVGTSIKFAIKTMFLIIVTMAAFMFFINFQLIGLTHYAALLIFVMWWVFITNEYNLWKESMAWGMVFLPILVVPVLVMLLTNILNYNFLLAFVYLSVGIYTFTYYLWALYAATGSLPFIGIKKREPMTSEFFAVQKKGMLHEMLAAVLSQFKKRLKEDMTKDIRKEESKFAWKK